MADPPRAAIRRACARKRTAQRQAAALVGLAVVGIVVAGWTSFAVFGGLVATIAIVIVIVQLVVIAWARQQIRLAVDQLIDTGTPAGDDREVAAQLAARLRELRGKAERRRTARILRAAIVDARRPRSSNPLVLAGRSVTLTRGAARALVAEQPLATRIATTLAESDVDPRAIVAVRNVLFPQPGAVVSTDTEEQQARAEIARAAHLLGIDGDDPPGTASRSG